MPTVYKGYTLPEHGERGWSEIVLTLFRDTIDTIRETDEHRIEVESAFTQSLNHITATNLPELVLQLDSLFQEDIDLKNDFYGAFQQSLSNISSTDFPSLLIELNTLFGDVNTLKADFYNSFNQTFNNLSANNFDELLIELDNLFSPNVNLFNDYAVIDVDESTDGNLIYAGYQDSNSNWLIKKVTINGSITQVRYATKIHAPTGSSYEFYDYNQAWSNKETITYVDIVTLYSQ